MKKLSLWAKEHTHKARLILLLSFIFLNLLGIYTGMQLNRMGIFLPAGIASVFFYIYLAGIAFYPFRWLKGKIIKPPYYYIWQKSCDLVLVVATFCLIVFFSNRPDGSSHYFSAANAAVITNHSLPEDSSFKKYKSLKEFSASLTNENGTFLKWKERKRLMKEQVKAIKKSNDLTKGERILLILLTILIALGLVGLVAGLACNLSCNGSETAAAILGIGGTVLIVFLTILVIRSILGKKRKVKPMPEPG